MALIYKNRSEDDVLELIDCSENAVMYNNDFNWKAEKPSNPSKDAIDRINDRLIGKITQYKNEEIREFYSAFKHSQKTTIDITLKNFNVVYNAWRNEIKFVESDLKDEQDIINLFLVDVLNGTTYKKEVVEEHFLRPQTTELELFREGVNLNNYAILYTYEKILDGIRYAGKHTSSYYRFDDINKYDFFWKKYKRPPIREEFLKILEHSASLYSDKYRRDTGGEYTPTCFVEKQNEILKQYYNLDEFIVMDPCCGVGNLENQFGKEFKDYCYLSTLEKIDVDTCRIKGFNNVVQFDYLKDKSQPTWNYKGYNLSVDTICQRENRKLMIVMNPPYQNKREYKNNMAIEFFNKVLDLKPQVIVFYYMTQSFHREEIQQYINSGYKIVSHIISNAKTTFGLSEWSVSQVIFDKDKGNLIRPDNIETKRYELEQGKFNFKGTYAYNQSRPNLFVELQKTIKQNAVGIVLGNVSYLNDVIKIGNGGKNRGNFVTTKNLKFCLLSKGLIFNTHHKYFELNSVVYRGRIKDISKELFNDAIMFSQFYIGLLFSNKVKKNFIMPFTHQELGCSRNCLNILLPELENNLLSVDNHKVSESNFDFREFFHSFEYSKEAMDLYNAALNIFKYYHGNKEYQSKDWNDSFYDITNAIMGKNPDNFEDLQEKKDSRISKVKATKGTRGFGKNTIRQVVAKEYLPIFEEFFTARDTLAKKINKQLVEQEILLWERENIY